MNRGLFLFIFIFMKSILRLVIIFIAAAAAWFIYVNTDHYLARQSWKYSHGLYMGDWVVFNKGIVTLKGRKIYKDGILIANVKIYTGNRLIITSPNGDTYGYYINK